MTDTENDNRTAHIARSRGNDYLSVLFRREATELFREPRTIEWRVHGYDPAVLRYAAGALAQASLARSNRAE